MVEAVLRVERRDRVAIARMIRGEAPPVCILAQEHGGPCTDGSHVDMGAVRAGGSGPTLVSMTRTCSTSWCM